jgi:hypothetical protein
VLKNALKICSAQPVLASVPPRIADRDQELTIVASLRLDREFTSRHMSFMASMALSIRFMNTCCNWIRSAIILGRPSARSEQIEIEYRAAWLHRSTIISRMSHSQENEQLVVSVSDTRLGFLPQHAT